MSCFEVVGENDTYVIYCFIECGYHTLILIFILEGQISECDEKNMSHLPKSQKSWGKSGGQKSDLVKP